MWAKHLQSIFSCHSKETVSIVLDLNNFGGVAGVSSLAGDGVAHPRIPIIHEKEGGGVGWP